MAMLNNQRVFYRFHRTHTGGRVVSENLGEQPLNPWDYHHYPYLK